MPPGPKKSLKSSKKASNNPYQGNPNEKPAWWSNINSLTIISLIIIVIISISIIYHIFYYNISSSATIPSNTKPASGTLRLIKELESISGLGKKNDKDPVEQLPHTSSRRPFNRLSRLSLLKRLISRLGR